MLRRPRISRQLITATIISTALALMSAAVAFAYPAGTTIGH
jgi:hypothetical protein